MGQAAKPAPTVLDAIEDDVEEAIRICDGDARLAVRGLIVMTEFLEAEAEAEGG